MTTPAQQLSGLDAAFLVLESETTPMQIGGVSILDPRLAGGGRLDFERLRVFFASRLGAAKIFRRRLAEVPFALNRPYWVTDPEFDLDRHLEHTTLPEPGGMDELAALMAWELSHPLPRDRPLWKMVLVEGVDRVPGVPAGSVALIGLVHHAAIDGVSGAEILGALFDLTPEPRVVPEAPLDPAELPSALALLRHAAGKGLGAAPGAWRDVLGRTAAGLTRAAALWGLERVQPPPMPFTAPRTLWNAPLTKDHVWHGTTLALDRLRALRDVVPEGDGRPTVNDLVLTVCAGALRRYLLARDELPAKPLVAMVPVSVREDDQRGDLGNQVSAMLVELATDEADPMLRLERVHRATHSAKAHHRALGARTLMDYTRVIPFSVAALAARLYLGRGLASRHRPLFNLVITNVPGPQVPLYLAGGRLLRHVGAAPIFDGMGLIVAVMSYAGELAFGVTSCRAMTPDVAELVAGLEASLAELESAIPVP